MPIGSETIANKYNLGVSSATIRNEISRLEKDGYVVRRHISGGSVPSDKGYRYYVEHLMQKADISTDERKLDRNGYFHQKVLARGKTEEFDALQLIASYYPALVKQSD